MFLPVTTYMEKHPPLAPLCPGDVMKRDLLADLSRAFLQNLPDEIREDYEERAAIMEFDGSRTRAEAEAAAFIDSTKGQDNG